MTTTKAVRVSLLSDAVRRAAFAGASRFRGEFYECLTARRPVFPNPRGASPGRPPGAKNKRRAPRYDVGRTVKRPEALKAIGKPGRSWQLKDKLSAGGAAGRLDRQKRSQPLDHSTYGGC